jgi:hypothetical protein
MKLAKIRPGSTGRCQPDRGAGVRVTVKSFSLSLAMVKLGSISRTFL